jgi:hypothetical protein
MLETMNEKAEPPVRTGQSVSSPTALTIQTR